MEKSKPSKKHAKGFTLADMMVATAIIVSLSVFMVVNFKVGRERDELRNGGLLLVSLLHQAQAYALAGKTIDIGGAVISPSGYGVMLDARNEVLYLYGDDNTGLYEGGESWIETYYLADYNIELDESTVCINFGTGCESGFESIDYLYTLPMADRSIIGGSKNLGTFEVVLRHPQLSGKGILLKSDAVTGQVILGSIEDI